MAGDIDEMRSLQETNSNEDDPGSDENIEYGIPANSMLKKKCNDDDSSGFIG